MKLMFVLRIALSFIFALLGAITAVQGVQAWGWFLFLAFIAIPSLPDGDEA